MSESWSSLGETVPGPNRSTSPSAPGVVRLGSGYEGGRAFEVAAPIRAVPRSATGDGERRPRLLDQLRTELRRRHMAPATEQAYVGWVRRFVLFHGKRHPRELELEHVEAFLNHLACEANVSASTQNQALNALQFLYCRVIGRPMGELSGLVRARRPGRLRSFSRPARSSGCCGGSRGTRCWCRCFAGVEGCDCSRHFGFGSRMWISDGGSFGCGTARGSGTG